jgi:hypothetical protein
MRQEKILLLVNEALKDKTITFNDEYLNLLKGKVKYYNINLDGQYIGNFTLMSSIKRGTTEPDESGRVKQWAKIDDNIKEPYLALSLNRQLGYTLLNEEDKILYINLFYERLMQIIGDNLPDGYEAIKDLKFDLNMFYITKGGTIRFIKK